MILYFSVAPVSLVPLGVHRKNRVRNVLSSLHFHFVDICYWRAERSVVKERTPLHDEKSCSVQDFRNLKRLHMRTSIGHSLSKLIGACDAIVKTLLKS